MVSTQKPYSPETVPASAWPLPRLRRTTYALDDTGWITGDPFTAEYVECPAELHLREFSDADVRDPQSLLELVRSVGLPLNSRAPWEGMLTPGLLPHLRDGQYRLEVQHAADQLELPTPNLQDRPHGEAAHVAEVGYRVVFIQILTQHLVAARSGQPTEKVWERFGFFDGANDAIDVGEDIGELSATNGAWHLFRSYLNNGLSVVAPRIAEPVDLFPGGAIDDLTDAFTAACICIFNDVVDALPYKRCAYEKCGRMFKHQLGPSGGQFRKVEGVSYCTPQHARNQSQLARRRAARVHLETSMEVSDS